MEKEFLKEMKAVLCRKSELEVGGAYADGVPAFLEDLKKHGVQVRMMSEESPEYEYEKRQMQRELPECERRAGMTGKEPCKYLSELKAAMEQGGWQPKEVLVLAATDAMLEAASDCEAAAFAWENPDYPNESRGKSPMLAESFGSLDYEFANRVWQRYHGLPWQILTTDRCYVRELMLSDLDSVFEMYAQKGMTDYMEPLYAREEEEAYQKAYIENMYRFYGYGTWLVFERQTDRLIGRIGLENCAQEDGYGLELGYAVAASCQRRGYASEVCRAVLAYAKEQLGYREVTCLIQQENEASRMLALKLGFVHTGTVSKDGKTFLRYVCLLDV